LTNKTDMSKIKIPDHIAKNEKSQPYVSKVKK
jgi:hypothetical protein